MVQMRAQVHGDRVPAQLEALAQVSSTPAAAAVALPPVVHRQPPNPSCAGSLRTSPGQPFTSLGGPGAAPLCSCRSPSP